ncbi:MAG: MBL fold metallo-hydrolase [Flavobacteriales bacterium]|nr:MBL fold metallo-hydrolase [Flavobacteriales bacterium]MBK6894100.1 MBL fold metallo-hydrolase [Flavobacteriales bacterium]MBK7248037.1 MBL fold metallo-hydrolase [Flavobacteriales bacterium]MBK9059774.1 MBL fold metallo-hydrolase [Flavobacteriales bacterium]MBK9598395.1 MBL fold metallo-hydrolase [Flavobacteriales bacterium]
MQLTFLGTGTSQGVPVIACACAVCRSTDPRDKRTRSSVLVETDGKTLLIDAGPDFRQQMLREGVPDLDAVLLTHEHMDHIAGMDDLRAISFAHEPPRPVPIYADEATLNAVRRVYAYAFSGSQYPGMPQYHLHTIGREPFVAAGIPVVPVEVMHYHMPVLGFRIGRLTYITDAKSISPEEKRKIRGSEVLVVNALRKKEHISHFNLQEALALIEELEPGRAYLTHISHFMGLHAEVELPPHVHIAHDGLKVQI